MTYDHIVVGAGIVGAATARALAESGSSVLLVEAFERGHDRGSSHGASRIFRHGYVDRDYVELSLRARDGWRELESASGQRILELTGAIDHGDPGTVSAIEAALAEAGLPTERLTADAGAARWPGLHFETDVLFAPSGGRLRADVAVEAMLTVAERAGAELRFSAPVEQLEVTDAGVAVTVGGDRIEARGLVVAAGSWTPALIGDWLAAQGSPLPAVRVTEEQPAHFPERPVAEHPDAGSAHFDWPSFVHYREPGADGVASPGVYGLLTPGEGVKVGLHGNGPTVDPSNRDRTIDPVRLAQLTAYVAEWVPGVDAAAPSPISCLYDNTGTEDFVLDRVGPVTVATGFSGHGFKFGPVLGDLLAALALHGTPAPERFRLPR
ncbi:FAD-dependent oxidoreductase [Leifsonia sp. NPDC058248]|uniref:FAD-dependent oxidoreductase n=1 Tax=Leifsonia sp. NPDC058248 TaxID=3346402 RepID=UPI0036DF4D07